MATNNSKSRTQFSNMKYEIANQLGINLKQGYNGDITARQAGTIGGNIVKSIPVIHRKPVSTDGHSRTSSNSSKSVKQQGKRPAVFITAGYLQIICIPSPKTSFLAKT